MSTTLTRIRPGAYAANHHTPAGAVRITVDRAKVHHLMPPKWHVVATLTDETGSRVFRDEWRFYLRDARPLVTEIINAVDEGARLGVLREAARRTDKLAAAGYIVRDEYRGLRTGAKVRHTSERYAGAMRDGTATVAVVMENPGSWWSQKHGRRDVEVVIVRDSPKFGAMTGTWADYHCVLIEKADP